MCPDVSPSPKLRRSPSQIKREELIELRLSAPFQKCVNGLRNAIDLPDVLDTILGFTAVCIANEHVLQQVSEEDDNNYFYDLEVEFCSNITFYLPTISVKFCSSMFDDTNPDDSLLGCRVWRRYALLR